MAVAVRVTVTGVEQLNALLRRMSPKANDAWVRRGLLKAAFQVQELATTKFILRGGGPKAPVHPKRLTSRTGTLRRSIRVDRGDLPAAIDVGTDLVYGAVHELGGRFHKARPFLAPALEKVSPMIEKLLADEWEKAVEGLGGAPS